MSQTALDLRVTAGADTGFVVWEAGDPLAAFSTAAELAAWLETRLRGIEHARRHKTRFEASGGWAGPRETGDTPEGAPEGLPEDARSVAGGPRDDLPAVILRPEAWQSIEDIEQGPPRRSLVTRLFR